MKGNATAEALERAGITCNKTACRFRPRKAHRLLRCPPRRPRLPPTRLQVVEFQELGHIIGDVLDGPGRRRQRVGQQAVKQRVAELCGGFPIYGSRLTRPSSRSQLADVGVARDIVAIVAGEFLPRKPRRVPKTGMHLV